TNTIVAENTAENGADVDGSFSGLANFVGGNPQLAALDNYGGLTDAMPPEFGSPVIDAGTDWVTNFLAADQRGFPRLAGVHVDIGAAEAQTAAADNPPVLKDARTYAMSSQGFPLQNFFAFSFTNAADADFTVLTTTNLAVPSARWTVWGNVSQLSPPMPPGEFSVVGLPTFNPQAFYRVVSP
ncbi:MAG: choice-of-anchor Q domain-containing protein, partial [Limisphaerales bacterium]